MAYKNIEKRRAGKKAWQKANNAKGLCRQCSRPRAVDSKGKMLTRCEHHRRREWTKWGIRGYVPPPRLMSLQAFSHLPDSVLAYAAGLIEGEGCLSPLCGKGKYRPYVNISVNMTDYEPVRWLHEHFGGNLRECPPMQAHHKPQLSWTAGGRRAGAVVAAIYKHLKSARRRRTARLLLKISSVCGWWAGSRAKDPEVAALFVHLRKEVDKWRLQH